MTQKHFLNINKLRLYARNPNILIYHFGEMMQDSDRLDNLALMKIYIFGLEGPLTYLEKKATQFQKKQEKIVLERVSRSIISSSVDEEQESKGMKLRERKKKKLVKKSMVLDSDESESEPSGSRSSKVCQAFRKYELRSHE